MSPTVLYLHGFASGPRSKKGVAFAEHFARRGVTIDRLDLRVPSLAHLRLSAMIDHVIARLGAETILIGSSLGGLTAARVAERDPRVVALILLAPAFQMIPRWRARLGDDAWAAWRDTGAMRVHDHTTGGDAEVDFGFAEDAAQVDRAGGGWPDVRVPTWIFHGRADDVVDVELSRTFARTRPHVQLTELDDGHELVASLPILLDGAARALAPWLP
jgi:pimeloyl-ACP methyl ester carboxylesterase